MSMTMQNPFLFLIALFSGCVVLWGLSKGAMPFPPIWIERDKYPLLYGATVTTWSVLCIYFLIKAF